MATYWDMNDLTKLSPPHYLPEDGWHSLDLVQDGYVVIRVDSDDHPLARQNGIVLLHRHVASVLRGSWLASNEMVLFLNGDRNNLSPDNLSVVTRKEMLRAVYPNAARVATTCEWCGETYLAKPSHLARRKRHYCSPECSQLGSRKFNPGPDELQQLTAQLQTYTALAKHYGVSDKAIAARCKKYGILLARNRQN